jgi:surfactin synthase thioesterase subunit
MELFLPVLRADFAVDETYVYRPDAPLSCPVSVFGGTADHDTLPSHLDHWRCETTREFTLRMLEGGHFFIESSRAALLAAVEEDLSKVGAI